MKALFKILKFVIVVVIVLTFVAPIAVYAETTNDVVEKVDTAIGNIEVTAAASSGGTWIEASDGRWWYKHSDGTYTTNGWEQIDGKWYYFDASGWMLTGWQEIDGYWYYFKPGDSGWMVTGWCQVGVNWYYLGNDGKMRTGWQKIDGYWYYFNLGDSGKMLTGWQKISSVWYYLGSDGKMCTGWKKVSEKWYYLGDDGKMRTGWQTINSKKYYFKPGDSGYMIIGWYKINNRYYYFQANGTLRTSSFSDETCNYVISSLGLLTAVTANVDRQMQERSNWCWAACSSMTGDFYTGTSKTQSSIVKKIKGSVVDEGASEEEIVNALRYATDYQHNWEYITNAHFDFQDAVDILDKKQIFVIRYEWSMFHGHILVCSGYNFDTVQLQLIDPVGDSPTEFYSYTALRHEATISSGVGWWNGTFRFF